jgi:hypothetical protein
LLFSTSSALLPALPFAFLTPTLNYVASITLRSEPPPTGLQLTKWYFGPQVDDMKAKLHEVRELGAATAEEWAKGLEMEGKEKAADVALWELWESAGGFQAVAQSITQLRHGQLPHREIDYCGTGPSSSYQGTATVTSFPHIRPTANTQAHPWTIQSMYTQPGSGPVGLDWYLTDLCVAPLSTLPPKPAIPTPPYGMIFPSMAPSLALSAAKPQARVEKSIQEANENKIARRAEIERRCAELMPPIRPSTLALMESFANALQIAMPLTDQAWELLKPRLLRQREAAEQQEQELLAQNQFLTKQTEERKQQEAQLKEAKETRDREWEETQKSVRERLETYADNFIREQWQNGDAVTRDYCAQFAVDMLLHVRHRFYNSIAQEDARMRSMGIPIPLDSPHAAPTRKLTLENMRWVYENKIKPFTEQFQKELFLCNACDNHGRYYSLDSVVQHFAAKHTDSLSMGTAVVYWKADWPELPPFDPNPTAAKAAMYQAAHSSAVLPPGQLMYHAPPTYPGHVTARHIPIEQPMYPARNAQHHHGIPPQGYGNVSPAYQEPPSPRYAPQGIDQAASRVYNTLPATAHPPIAAYGHPPAPDHHDWRRQPWQNTGMNLYQQHYPVPPPSHQPTFGARPGSALSYISQNPPYTNLPTASVQFSRPQTQAGTRALYNPIPPGQPMGIYQVQIQELARNAREIWEGMSGVTDMPDSVRVQVIIHHVVLRFRDKYTNEPSLALFTDGLNNNSQMAPLRALSGLSCKACATTNRIGGSYGNDGIRGLDHRLHTLPALLAHFQSAHVEHVQPIVIPSTGVEMPRPDWKFDMVEMPDENLVRNLIYSSEITSTALNLIATVFPHYCPTTSHDHRIFQGGIVESTTPFVESNTRGVHSQRSVQPEGGIAPQRPAYHSGDRQIQDVLRRNDAGGGDEYDPHRPSYVDANTSERHTLIIPDPHSHGPHYENEEIFARDVVSNVCARQKMENDLDNNLTAASPDYTVPLSNRPASGRSDVGEIEFPARNPTILDRQGRWTLQESRTFQVERKPTPAAESLSAAEQFLRNFDPPDAAPEPRQTTPAPGMSREIEYIHDFDKDPASRPRTSDHSWTSHGLDARTVEYNGKQLPSDAIAAPGRYERAEEAVLEPQHAREHDGLYRRRADNALPRTQHPSPASLDGRALSRARSSHLPSHLQTVRDSPSRRPSSRFERYEAQRQDSQRAQSRSPAIATESHLSDDDLQRDTYPTHRSLGRQLHAAQPEERYRRSPYPDEITYRRAPQSSQEIRYIDNTRYMEPVHERYFEYVRVPPRSTQASGEYYVQRPIVHRGADDYVGYEPTRPHEQVFEQEGHLYTRAPPSTEGYPERYDRHMTYQ